MNKIPIIKLKSFNQFDKNFEIALHHTCVAIAINHVVIFLMS